MDYETHFLIAQDFVLTDNLAYGSSWERFWVKVPTYEVWTSLNGCHSRVGYISNTNTRWTCLDAYQTPRGVSYFLIFTVIILPVHMKDTLRTYLKT